MAGDEESRNCRVCGKVMTSGIERWRVQSEKEFKEASRNSTVLWKCIACDSVDIGYHGSAVYMAASPVRVNPHLQRRENEKN